MNQTTRGCPGLRPCHRAAMRGCQVLEPPSGSKGSPSTCVSPCSTSWMSCDPSIPGHPRFALPDTRDDFVSIRNGADILLFCVHDGLFAPRTKHSIRLYVRSTSMLKILSSCRRIPSIACSRLRTVLSSSRSLKPSGRPVIRYEIMERKVSHGNAPRFPALG